MDNQISLTPRTIFRQEGGGRRWARNLTEHRLLSQPLLNHKSTQPNITKFGGLETKITLVHPTTHHPQPNHQDLNAGNISATDPIFT